MLGDEMHVLITETIENQLNIETETHLPNEDKLHYQHDGAPLHYILPVILSLARQ